MEAAFLGMGSRPRLTKFHTSTRKSAGLQYPRGLGTVDFDRSIQDDKSTRVVRGSCSRKDALCVFFGVLQTVWCGLVQKNRCLLLAFHNGRL